MPISNSQGSNTVATRGFANYDCINGLMLWWCLMATIRWQQNASHQHWSHASEVLSYLDLCILLTGGNDIPSHAQGDPSRNPDNGHLAAISLEAEARRWCSLSIAQRLTANDILLKDQSYLLWEADPAPGSLYLAVCPGTARAWKPAWNRSKAKGFVRLTTPHKCTNHEVVAREFIGRLYDTMYTVNAW